MQPQGADRELACSGRNSTVRILLRQVRFEHRKMGKDFLLGPILFALPKHGLAYFLGRHLWFKHHHSMDDERIIRHSLK